MVCPKCDSTNVTIITNTKTTGSNYSASKGCCGWLAFGGWGLLCGLCGEGQKVESTNYWVCQDCGKKFKV